MNGQSADGGPSVARVSPPSLTGAIAGGVAASASIMVANQLAHHLGLTDLDLPRVLGLTFRDRDQDAIKRAGLGWYLTTGGLLVPTLYWLGFRLLGHAGPGLDLAMGAVHYAVSGAILGVTRPSQPKATSGDGRPLGAFVSDYGAFEWTSNVLGHAFFALLVGAGARLRY